MSSITPTSTPTKKRTIRDLTNIYRDPSQQIYNHHTPLTPTKTPTKKQKIFTKSDDLSCKKKLIFTPTTPTKTPIQSQSKPLLTPSSSSKSLSTSIYSQTKNLFQRGYDNINTKLYNDESNLSLIGREKEAQYINEFMLKNIESNLSINLYISGPPGTGKTAQINLSLKKYETNHQIKIIKINCMTLRSPESIFHEIYSQLVNKLSISFTKRKNYEDLINELNYQNSTNYKQIILILDEIDFLISNGNYQVLLKLFQISNLNDQNQTKTKILLIGISNTLDLNNKFLPKLSLNNINSQNLQFLPYSSQQIKSIIFKKLSILSENIFHPVALQFCCQKAASISGDLRKAFDICYKSIELVEKEFKINSNNNNDIPNSKVMINHVAKICNESFNTNNSNNIISNINSLNILQQSILCYLINFINSNTNSNSCGLQFKQNDDKIRVQSFFEYYQKQHQIHKNKIMINSIKFIEFLEILNTLESTNCIRISNINSKNSNNNNNKIIKLNIEYDDIIKSLGNKELFKDILIRKRN
ncbi:CDC6 [Candida pseudojiufengensis]|uniref:CDC6 n=1 Tax=Candida pseudojiufengensis TaxID=497109 RepID=UPI002225604C|nr:CDC6 [Candida pseudojiufengensis]KAI5961451.1 CDC6 [Candida pseudojiufengensis]